MSQVKTKGTSLEIILRKYIWNKGVRGYITKSSVIGKPDIYFPKKNIAVFVDGCFWHKCPKCYSEPTKNVKLWREKAEYNAHRDKKNDEELKRIGITPIRYWGHEIKNNIDDTYVRLVKVLNKIT